MNPFLSLSVACWDLKCHSFLFVKCLQLEARAQKRVPRLYSFKISWTLCKIVNWQWHLMSKTNIHLLHTHRCEFALPCFAAASAPNVTLKYQKPSVQKFAEISKTVGTWHLILDQICYCQNLPKYQKSSLYNC